MSIVNKYFFLLIFCVAFSSESFGQAASSPFSSLGIGDYFGNALTHNQGMAGVGYSQPQYWFINNQNPALLVFNTLTTIEAGVIVESRTIKSDSISQQEKGGNLNYLVMAFPMKRNKWTTSIGLMPFTNVDYRLQYLDDVEGSTAPVTVTEEGTGGLSQFYWSNGVRLTPDFSIGLKATYIFSSITNSYSNVVDVPNQPNPFLVVREDKISVSDFTFLGGVSYSKDSLWNGNYQLSIGAIYSFGADLNTDSDKKFSRLSLAGDTIQAYNLTGEKGNITLPSGFGGGISISKGLKWSLGLDMYFQDWKKFKNVDGSNNNDKLSSTQYSKFALGGEFTPDYLSISYLKRITYRTGVSIENYPFLANDKQVKDFGINFGLSLPAGRSNINLAFRTGTRGNKADNILQENYFKIFFGVTFNDQWFIKRKFD